MKTEATTHRIHIGVRLPVPSTRAGPLLTKTAHITRWWGLPTLSLGLIAAACSGPMESDVDTSPPPPLLNQIVFESTRDDPKGDIFVAGLDGSGLRRLTGSTTRDGCPSVSPDGSLIAFMRDGLVAVMRSDGSQVRLLSTLTAAGCPSWSPDGTRVAFHRFATDARELWVIHLATDAGSKLSLAGSMSTPAWSPTRNEVAVTHGEVIGNAPPSNFNVFVVPVDGGPPTRITQPSAARYSGVTWSPEGDVLAFGCQDSEFSDWDVCSRLRDGSQPEVMIGGAGNQRDPVWSPMSGTLALSCEGLLCFWDGTSLTTVPATLSPAHITWDATGRWVALTVSNAGGRRDLHIVRADGSDRRVITFTSVSITNPSFGPIQ